MNEFLFDFAIDKVAVTIWAVLFKKIGFFTSAALTILGLLLFMDILEEALNIATGRGFVLDRKIMMWVFIVALVAGYPKIANGIFGSAKSVGNDIFKSFTELSAGVDKELEKLYEAKNSQKAPRGISATIGYWLKHIPFVITLGASSILIGISIIAILVLIASAYATLGLSLLVGPIFIIFFQNPTFRSLGVNWVSNVISYFVMIPLYGFVLKICVNIYIDSFASAQTFLLEPTGWKHLFAALFGPILCIGILMFVPKMINGLMGAVAGDAGGLIGAGFVGGMAGAGAVKAVGGTGVWAGKNAGKVARSAAAKGGRNFASVMQSSLGPADTMHASGVASGSEESAGSGGGKAKEESNHIKASRDTNK